MPDWKALVQVQQAACTSIYQARHFGQPAAQTHPHLLAHDEVTPGITKDHFKKRRHKMMESILDKHMLLEWTCDRHIVIIPSAAVQYMTNDIPYVFRQNTNFLYLCGFQEPDSVLVIECHKDSLPDHKATLFVRGKDPYKELWEGERSGTAGAVHLTGVDDAQTIDTLPAYLTSYAKENSKSVVWYNNTRPNHARFHRNQLQRILQQYKPNEVYNPDPILHELRLIKSEEEIYLMQKSNDIASEAFQEVLRFSKPGVDEAHLYAKMDFECRVRGAEYLAYPPVVAGGNRANTIHYTRNNQLVPDGHMVLMDAGCEYHGYASDLTRTWPVNGQFSEPQRELYETLLEIQEQCLEMLCNQDTCLEQLNYDLIKLVATHMRAIGVIPRHTDGQDLIQAAREICPHTLGHYLGMDVHDTHHVSIGRMLKPGMVITVEPGVYIPETRTSAPGWFRGIGIRIEDNVLITQNGYHNFTTCPKRVDDIEKLMKNS